MSQLPATPCEPVSPATSTREWWTVIGGGLITSVLALLLCYIVEIVSNGSFNIMGLYLWFVLPAGAVFVGLVAGSGYGLAAWLIGAKISKPMLRIIIILQIIIYALSVYLMYVYLTRGDFSLLSFIRYYDYVTQNMGYSISNHGKSTGPPLSLGAFGYVARLLELAGFVCGAFVMPQSLRGKPYCETCQRYMKTRYLVNIEAGNDPKKYAKALKKGNPQGMLSPEELAQQAQITLEELTQHATAGDVAAFQQLLARLAPHNKKLTRKLPRLIETRLCYCPHCYEGRMVSDDVARVGNNIYRNPLGNQPLSKEFVKAVVG